MGPTRPQTRYALSGDVHIAYQVVGDGPRDLVMVPGFATHVELAWESAPIRRFNERLASFSRLIVFDKRGMGLSDRVPDVPTLEQRMDDVRAVMDDAGSERAVLFGISEGVPMCVLHAVTYPERTDGLVLHGAVARGTEDEDYPWGAPRESLMEAVSEFIAPSWGRDATVSEIFTPSLADDAEATEFLSRLQRSAASPGIVRGLFLMLLDIDVRPLLPLIRVPTLVIHRTGDRAVSVHAGRWVAGRIPGARFVELPGADHLPFAGDQDAVIDEVEEFVTGSRHTPVTDRVLCTVMLTDIVGSTELAASLGDRRWHQTLDAHHAAVRRELERFRGREVKNIGDGFLAAFDGPARAIRCGMAIADSVRPLGLELRVGLHSGECEVMGDDLGGIAVHIASRVAALAGPGEVVVTGTVRDLVAGSGIEFDDRGSQTLKGVPGAWPVLAVRG